jgi:hypothetical protein
VTASGARADARVTHALVRERWGEPDVCEGSVNDPRTREEHGVRWNEKWIWLLPGDGRRVAYWHRYDFRGAFREDASGEASEEPL